MNMLKFVQVTGGLLLALCVLSGMHQAERVWGAELKVAAASDLNFAFKDLVAEYEQKTGEHIKLTLGSSGTISGHSNFSISAQDGTRAMTS